MGRVALGLSPVPFTRGRNSRGDKGRNEAGTPRQLRLVETKQGLGSGMPLFALSTGALDRPLQKRSPLGTAISIVMHVAFLALFLALVPRYAKVALPDVPDIWAFVVSAPPATAPAPAPAPLKAAEVPEAKAKDALPPTPAPETLAAIPIAAAGIAPETGLVVSSPAPTTGFGVEGGVSWGTGAGGILLGLPEPPPPPPAPSPPQPIRVGGDITEPALLYRAHPEYPQIAQAAMLEGIVILEATVDGDGRVESVRVLRSKGALLDRAAIDAVKQWRYSPLIFHGKPHPFILTVTVSFSLERRP